jgi:protein-S-isoprenylcysteine O-methyltransferase Ste14
MAVMPTDSVTAGAIRLLRTKSCVFLVLLSAVLIAGSGRPDWVGGWVYILVVAAGQLAAHGLVTGRSPDLIAERAKLQKGTKPWDKVLAPLVAIMFPLAMWIVAALDTRFGWSGFAGWVRAAGFVLIVLGMIVILWAMLANRFFAATVRIQTDRGHSVVSRGPYARVRHPGYVGALVYTLGTPLALDSVPALLPAGLCVAALVLRTGLEDSTLQAELEGYAEYARRVRWRLIPAIW